MSDEGSVFESRAHIMRAGLDLARMEGLEIGALARPIVRRDEGRIIYVDHTDGSNLRRTYADNPHVCAADIVDVDATWGERTLSDCLGGRQVDYVMASHVAEHVPDLVTWLQEVRTVLRPGGQVRLALPDARFSFDTLRAPTRLSDVLTAYLLRARRPQVRDVLDFRLHYAPAVDPMAIYRGEKTRADYAPAHEFALAVSSAEWARDLDEYFDVHCWVGAARDFASLMQRLAGEGLVGLACAGMVDTAPPLFEFYAFLERCDDPAAAAETWAAVRETLRDPLPGSAAARRVEADREAAAHAAAETDRLRHELAAARARLAGQVAAVTALRESSSWRLTAPLRSLRTRLDAVRRSLRVGAARHMPARR